MTPASPSDPYDFAYALPSIPTLTTAILAPPFVNPPSSTALGVQATYIAESTSRPVSSISTATMTAGIESQVTFSISNAAIRGSEAPAPTYLNGECDQSVTCVDGVNRRALRPIPVIDSGSMPLRGRRSWTWLAGWSVFSMSTCVLLML